MLKLLTMALLGAGWGAPALPPVDIAPIPAAPTLKVGQHYALPRHSRGRNSHYSTGSKPNGNGRPTGIAAARRAAKKRANIRARAPK